MINIPSNQLEEIAETIQNIEEKLAGISNRLKDRELLNITNMVHKVNMSIETLVYPSTEEANQHTNIVVLTRNDDTVFLVSQKWFNEYLDSAIENNFQEHVYNKIKCAFSIL